MSDKMSDTDNKQQCCQDSNCCSTGNAPGLKDKRSVLLRILISVGVLLIAAGVTAYVLLTRYPSQVSTPVKGTTQAAPVVNRSAISDLAWVKKIYENPSGCTYTFALLRGEDAVKNSAASNLIDSLVKQLEKDNIKIDFYVLDRSDPEYTATTNRLLIQETPAVIGLNSIGNIAIIKGAITTERLYETYIISSSSCCPPAGGKCCGSN